ncbi:MAG: FHA domain-containing protein [Planctomycetota bacterium]|nr:FHA domain-containing protein [Planctomycetota bacterium]
MFGELVPLGGGDSIPMLQKKLRVGRREGCDIILAFPNVSSHHCLLEIDEGYWFVKDLKSRNGIKVNNKRIMQGMRKRVDPGDVLRIAKHEFKVEYEPHKNGAYGSPPQDEYTEATFSQSLMERAGLTGRRRQ